MKKTLGLVICLCILLCTLAVSANEPPDTITWAIDNGTLTISGTGAMEDYRNESDAPWYSRKSEITKIVVEDGINHIGNLAFYGLTNAKEAIVADSVETIGLCAFSYTEGTKTSIDDLNLQYRFDVESDSSVVSAGDEFTVSVNLTADFKDVLAVQSILLFDQERILIDGDAWYDTQWYDAIDKTNLGYISKPMSGIVANNLRLLYISMGGTKIDENSPLYNAGKKTLTIAKVKCKAIKDIEDINTSCFAIKSSSVLVDSEGVPTSVECAETQLTNTTRLPIKDLVINGKANTSLPSAPVIKEEAPVTSPVYEELTVIAGGKTVSYDAKPYVDANGILMLPLRYTLEAMGASVTWDNQTSTAFVIYNGDLVAVQIGRDILFKNDSSVTLKAPVSLLDGRTMVSSDCIENAFDFALEYAKDANLVTISK